MMFLVFWSQIGIAAFAQTQFGIVSGQIEDESGAIVANAEVRLTNMATSLSQTATSNNANFYAYPGTNTFSGAASGPGSQVLARRGVDAGDRKEQRNIQLAIRLLF